MPALRIVSTIVFALLILAPLRAEDPKKPDAPKAAVEPKPAPAASFFFALEGARDCVYDESRQRLYVTTAQKLMVVDIATRKILEAVELGGTLGGIDISPDFKFLAIAPLAATHVNKVDLNWKTLNEMEIKQIRFAAESTETGVHSVCIGADKSILFSPTRSGSGQVKLRKISGPKDTVTVLGNISQNSMMSASAGDRKFALLALGNSSAGHINLFDYAKGKAVELKPANKHLYEIACGRAAKYYARPDETGVDLYESSGARLGSIDGAHAIAAAFHPKNDTVFVMRHGQMNIEQYDVAGKTVSNSYPLDKPLVVKTTTVKTDVVDLIPIGKDGVQQQFRTIEGKRTRAYSSGRLKVSENGETLMAIIPAGVYVFPIKAVEVDGTTPKPKITVVDPTVPKKK